MNQWIAAALLSLFVQPALAGWLLDQTESRVHFVTTKNVNFTEVSYVRGLAGDISEEGHARLTLDLRSVETHVPDRNERLQTGFFDVGKFPAATVALKLDGKRLQGLAPGVRMETDATATVTLHGVERKLDIRLAVIGLKDEGLEITSLTPVIVAVEDFGLTQGLEAMRAMVELKNIGNKVPVTFNLVFASH